MKHPKTYNSSCTCIMRANYDTKKVNIIQLFPVSVPHCSSSSISFSCRFAPLHSLHFFGVNSLTIASLKWGKSVSVRSLSRGTEKAARRNNNKQDRTVKSSSFPPFRIFEFFFSFSSSVLRLTGGVVQVKLLR